MIRELAESIRKQKGPILVAGDFNSKSPEWGSRVTDKRGEILSYWLAEMDLIVMNEGEKPTFVRNERGSNIDVTLANTAMAQKVVDWIVLDEETHSLHRYLQFQIKQSSESNNVRSQRGWNFKKLDREKFITALKRADEVRTQTRTDELVEKIKEACDKSAPRLSVYKKRSVYWWNDEIAIARKECVAKRRQLTRGARQNGTMEEQRRAYRTAKKKLRTEINRSKDQHWKALCQDIDRDPWGQGYKIATKRIKTTPPEGMRMEEIKDLASNLFPTHEGVIFEQPEVRNPPPHFTMEELEKACQRLKEKKAPGPDGIIPEIAKMVVKEVPEWTLGIMNEAITTGEYPIRWKEAKLILIRKGNKPIGVHSSYRPICLLDTLGKLLEQLILGRLTADLERVGGLSERQYGFRKGKTTIGAIEEVIKTAKEARNGTWRTRKLCVLVTVDVKNAFNSAPWQGILEELKRRDIAPYLLRIIGSYLKDRTIVLKDYEGKEERMTLSSGVPQGSVLGPTLWNVLYDGILDCTAHEEGITTIAYADDLALIVTDKTEEGLQSKTNRGLLRIWEWLNDRGLAMAPEKSEAVLLTGRRRVSPLRFNIHGKEIVPKDAVMYLGVLIDKNINFRKHLVRVADKADTLATALGRLMPNVEGPRPSKRKLLCSVVHSVLLYASPIWGRAMEVKSYRYIIERVQRKMAIRVSCAYRTVSSEAALVVAGVIPIKYLVEERMAMEIPEQRVETENNQRRERTMELWQTEWDGPGKGRWTRKLIRNLRGWTERKHGEVNYWTTQVLTGHGCFGSYLNGIGKAETDKCVICDVAPDTPQHAIFECNGWDGERRKVNMDIGEEIIPENIVRNMIKTEVNWNIITSYLTRVMKTREDDR